MGCVSFIRSQSRQGVAIAERSMQLLARGLNLFSQLRWSLGQSLGPTAAPVAGAAADSDEGDQLGIIPPSLPAMESLGHQNFRAQWQAFMEQNA